jgi:hypothetical protein
MTTEARKGMGGVVSKHLSEWSRKELLALPARDWEDVAAAYDSLLVFSARRKHDSGWSMIYVVGCREQKPVEICCACADDLEWVFPDAIRYGDAKEYTIGQVRTDCTWPAGILHFWLRDATFRVGAALSSVTITVTRTKGATGS